MLFFMSFFKCKCPYWDTWAVGSVTETRVCHVLINTRVCGDIFCSVKGDVYLNYAQPILYSLLFYIYIENSWDLDLILHC